MPGAKVRIFIFPDIAAVFSRSIAPIAENNIILEVTKGTMKKVFPMGIENVSLTEKVQKVMVDGVLYIVRDGKMFNVQGAQVR